MVDFHCHILPEIDDGPQKVTDSIELLKMQKEQGVDTVVATPHINIGKNSINTFLSARRNAYSKLLNEDRELLKDIKICLGAEVTVFLGISEEKDLDKLCIEGTNAILLELPFGPINKWIYEELYKIVCARRIIPVIAHIDRYITGRNDDKIEKLFSLDAVIQFNADWIIHTGIGSKKIYKAINENRVHIIGSDCHNLNARMPNILEAKEKIVKHIGHEPFDRLMNNAYKLLDGQNIFN